jgi:hypothetical protein
MKIFLPNKTSLKKILFHEKFCYSLNKENGMTKNKLKFEYGNSDFKQVCKPGIFHIDRTNYIPELENVGEILTFIRPPSFGKSMIISMLEYYYDIIWKNE